MHRMHNRELEQNKMLLAKTDLHEDTQRETRHYLDTPEWWEIQELGKQDTTPDKGGPQLRTRNHGTRWDPNKGHRAPRVPKRVEEDTYCGHQKANTRIL
eukprot:11687240-Heterocapsa_arctica.AAC.1